MNEMHHTVAGTLQALCIWVASTWRKPLLTYGMIVLACATQVAISRNLYLLALVGVCCSLVVGISGLFMLERQYWNDLKDEVE